MVDQTGRCVLGDGRIQGCSQVSINFWRPFQEDAKTGAFPSGLLCGFRSIELYSPRETSITHLGLLNALLGAENRIGLTVSACAEPGMVLPDRIELSTSPLPIRGSVIY